MVTYNGAAYEFLVIMLYDANGNILSGNTQFNFGLVNPFTTAITITSGDVFHNTARAEAQVQDGDGNHICTVDLTITT